MSFKRLQLNLLSQTGELINCVSCFPGQVSVFRAPSYAALEVYQRALAGIPGPERISISLDERSYIPTEHFFIGFGEQRESAHETVISSFSRIGINENVFHGLCHSYGIEIEESSRWASLTRCEARRMRLLLATQTRGQIIILNDPFEPLANQWRERFAELIAQFARQNKEIIIVTNLSNRPEAWIDNASIARIQVGEEIQKTIGFGAQASAGNEMIQQLRTMMKEPKPQPTATFEIPQEDLISAQHSDHQYDEERPHQYHSSILVGLCTVLDTLRIPYNDSVLQKRFLAIQSTLSSPVISSSIAATLIIGASAFLFSGEKDEPAKIEVASLNQTQVATTESGEAQNTERVTVAEPAAEVISPEKLVEVPKEPQPKSNKVIDEYPESIKSSIMASFQGLGTALEGSKNGQNELIKSAPKEEETGDLLKLLASASDSGEGLPDAPPPSDASPDNSDQSSNSTQPTQFGSEEEKREAIRKRFLEAIERAQSMRKN
jgi:hypothetical protein